MEEKCPYLIMLLLSNFRIAVAQRNLSNSSKSALADEKLPPEKSSILLPQDAPAVFIACEQPPNLQEEGRSKPKPGCEDPALWDEVWEGSEEPRRLWSAGKRRGLCHPTTVQGSHGPRQTV